MGSTILKWRVAALLLLQLIFTSYSSTNISPGGQVSCPSSENSPIQTPTQNLAPGQNPKPIAWHTTEYRTIREKLEDLIKKFLKEEVFDAPVSRFEGKHLYKNGIGRDSAGNPLDSYALLTTNPMDGRNYLIELNLKLYKGGVLPHQGRIPYWFKNIHKTFVTIVDATYEDINNNIEFYETTERGDHYKTTKEYIVTDFSFHPVADNKGNVVSVYAEAKQFKTKVIVGVDKYKKVSHLESIDRSIQLAPTIRIPSFTVDELLNNAEMTNKFWKDMSIPAKTTVGILLNEGSSLYRKFKPDYETKLKEDRTGKKDTPIEMPKEDKPNGDVDCGTGGEGGRGEGGGGEGGGGEGGGGEGGGGGRKKRSASICAGEEDYVHTKEYIEEYKRANADRKRKLTEFVKDNMDKFEDSGEEVDTSSKNKLSKLVQLEQVKKHVDAVNIVSQVEDGKIAGGQSPPLNVFDSLHSKLSNVKTKLSNSKVDKGLASIANPKCGIGSASGVGKMSDTLGKFFLAKTVINGITTGDTTSLTIVGARVGYEVGTGAAVWGEGAEFVKGATKVGKAAKYLGNVAGPIGAEADIGLSVWSLSKSASRLRNATSQYERNDAIADIVYDSADIAITATVTALSNAFPPDAPKIIAEGAVSDLKSKLAIGLFNTVNEVARINEEVPLLGFDKEQVITSRLFDWFGSRNKDYNDHLLEEKAGIDLADQHNLKFLEENPTFLGIVFPSRTLAYDGGCNLTVQHCALALGCAPWESKSTAGTGCDWNRPCSSNKKLCNNYWEARGEWGIDDFKCVCTSKATISFGVARQDSFVDFRKKQRVFWERAVPKEVENGVFQCKPGSTKDQGYKISQNYSRSEYLCENAIALEQPSSRRWANNTQVMLYNLEDGHDRVYLNPDSLVPNLFLMGSEGRKEFVGGGGARNEFMFNGDCTKSLRGSLAGGRSTADAITILSNCARGGEMRIDFVRGTLKDSRGNVDMSFSNIEEITGRKGEGELVTASCGSRKVVLQGGSSKHRDWVDIGTHSHCAHNLTLVIANYTTVTSRATRGDINLLVDSSWTSVNTSVEVQPKENLRMNIIFLNTSSHQVFLDLASKAETGIQGTISRLPGKSDQFGFNFTLHRENQNVSLFFTETPKGSPHSVLVLSPEAPLFYHALPEYPSFHMRRGALNVSNLFEVVGRLWSLIGGDKNDEFVLHSIPTFVDGGDGEDLIRLHANFPTRQLVDLTGSNFRSIENFYGVAGTACKLKTSCDTKLVVPQGGSKTEPDVVTVPACKCTRRDLQIVAKGHTRVVIEDEVGPAGRDTVTVVAISEKESPPLQLQLNALSGGKSDGLAVFLPMSHKNWTVKQCTRNLTTNLISLALGGSEGESVEFKLRPSNSTYLSSPYIQLSIKDSKEPPGHLVIEEETTTPKVIFHLDQKNSSSDRMVIVTGFQRISNVFRIQNPSSSWNIVGGMENDVFSISQLHGVSVDGGPHGDDTLILELHPQNIGKTFIVNLENQTMLELGSTGKAAGNVNRVHHLIGRAGQPDLIHVDCHTKSVAGLGGHGGQHGEDVIFISWKNCTKSSNPPQTSIHLGKHSKVLNSGSPGLFTYYVEDITTSQLELTPTVDNSHFVKFGVHPWQVIGDVGFSQEGGHVLELKLKQSGITLEDTKILNFPMLQNKSSGEYVNPVLEFHPPSSFVRSDIRVLGDGVTTSTIYIQGPPEEEDVVGLPVDLNRFLINITTKQKDGRGGGGGGVIRGGAESNNQFWLFRLENELQVLDGGHCSKKGASCTNYLQFDEKFHPEEPLEVDFSSAQLKIGSKMSIETVRNFQQVVGRSGNNSYDTVHVSCGIKQVSEFESVVVGVKEEEEEDGEKEEGECGFYNLIIGVGKETRVQFQSHENHPFLIGRNDTFHYRFTVPRSFELEREGDDFDVVIGPTHNFYLPFKVDDLEELRFNSDTERLHYRISGEEEYSIAMIEHVATEQFYLQPVMITQDGFRIQVAAIDGTILLSLGAGSSSQSLDTIKSEMVPGLEHVASKLGVTILVQTDKELLYVGHRKVEGDRNVLQNVGYSVSHLVGGGADDTIYEIVSLNKDVYIYPGYHELTEDDELKMNRTKQTIDLTDVVVPIRVESGTKYVPEVERVGDDIVVSMAGWESRYPGRIFIVDGAVHEGRRDSGGMIQVLLSAAMFDFVGLGSSSVSGASLTGANSTGWRLSPRPINIPEGMVYSLSEADLEDVHLLVLETSNDSGNGNGSRRRRVPDFRMVRNGTDLYITDVMGVAVGAASDIDIIEVTTIVISDYFKGPKNSKESSRNGTEQQQQHNHTEGE